MDILGAVAVNVRCHSCGNEYQVPLRQALLSHEMLHDGCPLSDERECPPLFWAQLMDEQLIRELQSIWNRLEDKARKAGGELVWLAEEQKASVR